MVSQCEVEIGLVSSHVGFSYRIMLRSSRDRCWFHEAPAPLSQELELQGLTSASFGVEVVVPISAMTISKSSFCNVVVHRS
jgi:hypothetical protein